MALVIDEVEVVPVPDEASRAAAATPAPVPAGQARIDDDVERVTRLREARSARLDAS
jgi:hypothetical protein